MQILSCSGTLGTCCSDYGLVMIIDTTRRILDLIQIVVPIMLIIWGSYGLFRMVMNPEEKNGVKKVINKFIVAIVVFMIPVLVNATIGLMPSTFSLNACWKQAKSKAEVARGKANYIKINDKEKTTSILPKPEAYEKSKPKATPSYTYGGTSVGNATESAIVAYAKQFIGSPYKYGGSWNGNLPYTPTDCVGFVRGVYKHFGIDVPASNSKLQSDKSKFTIVTNSEKHPGDIVLYNGHWAMLTGNGTEIIHAMSPKLGIRTSKDYRKSSKPLVAVIRVNAVSR